MPGPRATWFIGLVVGAGLACPARASAGTPDGLQAPVAAAAGDVPAARSVFRHPDADPATPWRDSRPAQGGTAWTALPVSVVEIPAPVTPGLGPPGKVHHALSLRLGAAEKAMQSWGIQATDCRLQFRAPTKVLQSRGGVTIDAMAQVRFGCRF